MKLTCNLPKTSNNPITIIDARDSGLEWPKVQEAVRIIAKKELVEDESWVSASSYIKEEYFKGVPINPGPSSPETILLATVADDIVGFIVTEKRLEKGLWSSPADTGHIAYIAVDSSAKRLGVGTKLMLAVMRKTKELGKRYLTLVYIAQGLGLEEQRCRAKTEFYNSFTTKFGIPMEEKGNVDVSRQLHVHPYYDLQDVDLKLIT